MPSRWLWNPPIRYVSYSLTTLSKNSRILGIKHTLANVDYLLLVQLLPNKYYYSLKLYTHMLTRDSMSKIKGFTQRPVSSWPLDEYLDLGDNPSATVAQSSTSTKYIINVIHACS